MQKVQLRGKVIFSLVIYYNFSLYVRNRILIYLYVHRNINYMYFGVLDIVAYTYSYPRTYYHKLRTIIKLSTLLLLIMYRRTHSYTGQSYYNIIFLLLTDRLDMGGISLLFGFHNE